MKHVLAALILLLTTTYTEAASRFAVCTAACTWDASSTLMWSTSSGGATGASVPGAADTVTLNAATCVGGVTCTITVNTTVNVISITMGACTASTTGCILDFSVNNNNVTLDNFDGSGGGTRALKMGNGTWTMTGTGTPWFMSTSVGMTLTPGSSVLSFTNTTYGTRQLFMGGSLTYGAVSIAANSSGGAVQFEMLTPTTLGSLSIVGPNNVTFKTSNTLTITNAFNFAGTPTAPIFLGVTTINAVSTISVATGTPTMSWASVRGLTFSGGATFTASNSLNLGGNTGISITAPSAGGGACILGGWLLWRDMPDHLNDNFPAWLEKAA